MRTQILPASDTQAFAHAVRLLRAGKVVAFPTDTVYGVGAHGMNVIAVESLFIAKERPRDRAIPLLIASANDLPKIARDIPQDAITLAQKFWPGALTLIVFAREGMPKNLLAQGNTVAVRVPNHPLTRTLIQELGGPIAATSANISSQPDPSTAQQVMTYLNGRIQLIIDGGATPGNVPSTIVDVTTDPPTIMRLGVISAEQIEAALGRKIK